MSGDEMENPVDTIEWNDDLLVKEYEKYVKESPNLEDNCKENEPVDDNVLYEKGDSTDKVKSSNERKVKFKVGDYARAVYNDGYEYEGKILQLDEDTQICQLIYIGYGDEQAVKIEDLTESWGRQARRDQFLKAKQDGKKSHKVKKKVPMNFPPELNQLPQPPPMPPAPQGLGDDSEHLSTMLMSWYMSGYYTGFYQGLKSAQTTTKRKKAS